MSKSIQEAKDRDRKYNRNFSG